MREVLGGGSGTASDMMELLMVIIGGGFDSNYMIAAQYSLSARVCVCVTHPILFKRNIHKIAAELNCLFAAAAWFSHLLCVSEGYKYKTH